MKYRKKPVIIEASQWHKNGDHPLDHSTPLADGTLSEGAVVQFLRQTTGAPDDRCKHCGQPLRVHGWVDTLEGGHIVCPGDFIITGVKGERYPCKPDVFLQSYEPAE